MNLGFIFSAVKPFLGVLDLKIDRTRQIITFKRDGQTETLTVDQLYDEIERMFPSAKPAAQVTLDPFGGGTIDRINPQEGAWLSDYHRPSAKPLGQALTEQGRPLAAPSA